MQGQQARSHQGQAAAQRAQPSQGAEVPKGTLEREKDQKRKLKAAVDVAGFDLLRDNLPSQPVDTAATAVAAVAAAVVAAAAAATDGVTFSRK